ncbi:hypothetical protein NBRC111894_4533 [Sporolactobacillus inulinus]|uniref:Uncharacterized protein n=1 Tax=Sporolactobacillus inulinus TaxID=2078 RepID=A0A4Y1ZIY1_9BACL|nr:hypothetical protein NBRC111894_4533 [Sporolactobacillus inulinus]
MHTGRTSAGCGDFRVAYRTYAHLAEVPFLYGFDSSPYARTTL